MCVRNTSTHTHIPRTGVDALNCVEMKQFQEAALCRWSGNHRARQRVEACVKIHVAAASSWTPVTRLFDVRKLSQAPCFLWMFARAFVMRFLRQQRRRRWPARFLSVSSARRDAFLCARTLSWRDIRIWACVAHRGKDPAFVRYCTHGSRPCHLAQRPCCGPTEQTKSSTNNCFQLYTFVLLPK